MAGGTPNCNGLEWAGFYFFGKTIPAADSYSALAPRAKGGNSSLRFKTPFEYLRVTQGCFGKMRLACNGVATSLNLISVSRVLSVLDNYSV